MSNSGPSLDAMGQRKGLLARIDAARTASWIASLRGRPTEDSIEEILDPGLRQVSRFSDEEIAEVIAREPNTKLGHLAASVMRRRESWRTPARWALLISLGSMIVSAIALLRTL